METSFAVVGAGIIGITSAWRILDNVPNAKVTIFAEKFSPNTTSDVSAGFWEPYCLNVSEEQLRTVLRWGKETYDIMLKTSLSNEGKKAGVQGITAFVIQNGDAPKIPFWSKIVSQFRTLNKDDVDSIIDNTSNFANCGFSFLSTTVVVNEYIPFLMEELRKNGVEFVSEKVDTIHEFIEKHENKFDYIINCTGLGARTFVNDKQVYPVRGQVIRVKAPYQKHAIMVDVAGTVAYALPLSDQVVIGGSQEKDNFNTDNNESQIDKILNTCYKILPALRDAEIVSKTAGLRPCRDEVRLEKEIIITPKYQTKVIHNYGHGGSGVTLCWGCATDVVKLVMDDLKSRRSKL